MYAIRLNGEGRCETLKEDVLQSLKILLHTPKGTRIYDPEYGCDAMSYVDRPQWEMSSLMVEITKQVNKYEKRITLGQLFVGPSEMDNGQFAIRASMTIHETGEYLDKVSLL
ncbi:GPW/gp25 family protein [Vibrio sp. OPT18]|uniref:GPW/gp25 family protein n=1 Tax=Vibrio sp. OPT18 TaxID=2778641 RepID=UPI001881CAD7|nr:GPW/gp25 family protein [Vibrio sp. OPT18]MBE8578712.1 GPW/gp25 family protein [Vibrio sp. OPT18]